MIDSLLEDEDWTEPQRDDRGRFVKGVSGNPNGRPRKPTKKSWTVEESIAEALAENVAVAGPDGSSQWLAMRDLLIKTMIRGAVKAKPKDQLKIIEGLLKLGVLRPTSEEEGEGDEGCWTDAELRYLERVAREVATMELCRCHEERLEPSMGVANSG